MEENNEIMSPEELIKENEQLKANLRETIDTANKRIKEIVNEAETRLSERDYTNAINRVKLLQECVAHADKYPEDFINYVVSEIVNTLTILPEDTDTAEKEVTN